jgi:hypothetical protein
MRIIAITTEYRFRCSRLFFGSASAPLRIAKGQLVQLGDMLARSQGTRGTGMTMTMTSIMNADTARRCDGLRCFGKQLLMQQGSIA